MDSLSKDEGLIVIRGARQHNLKNINLDIPRGKLTVVTGLSGSGKSSLAFDTIFAEGRRRYVESLSSYARQFLGQMDKPDVDLIEGLSPAIAIEQKTTGKNPRSTVGTATEIYDYLRLLYARAGEAHCHQCGRPINSRRPADIVDQLLNLPPATRLIILAPIIIGRKGDHQKIFNALRKDGFSRVRVGGEIRELESSIELDKNKKHNVEAVVDRLIIKEGLHRRITDSVELALKTGDGALMAAIVNEKNEIIEEKYFSERFACDYCSLSFPELTPQLFSFNSPQGACPECDGLGGAEILDPDLLIPDTSLSLLKGAIAPLNLPEFKDFKNLVFDWANFFKLDVAAPIGSWPKEALEALINGSGDKKLKFPLLHSETIGTYNQSFEGVLKYLKRVYDDLSDVIVSQETKQSLEQLLSFRDCPLCHGARLRPQALAVMVSGRDIASICNLTIAQCLDFFIHITLSPTALSIARRIIKEIRDRLEFLRSVGLGYLSLSRAAGTLSGGESQRIRLATQIGAKLVGVMYVLDEPSVGLHQRDNQKLLASLKKMRDIGNTVIVVEHDAETIMEADHVIDLGPGAGENGGHLIFDGPPPLLLKCQKSLTGRYLSGDLTVNLAGVKAPGPEALKLSGARANNLKDITVSFPLGRFTAVTGVSGSGKSTLVIDTLYRILAQKLHRAKTKPGKYDSIEGLELIDKVIDIDQSPIGRTPRSNPATYIGLFSHIRELFSRLPEARARGYQPGRFSFNVKGGRCEKCQGDGVIKIEMLFLPDVYVRCEVCQGSRYNRDTLEIKYAGSSISDVLNMTAAEAAEFFKSVPYIKNKLDSLADVGLGYLKLGQPATTLSGGEAQRIKLCAELSRRDTGKTVYILDEPTTGLHFDDVKKLLETLRRLVSQGNTIIVIEHNLDVIKNSDYVIDLGPEGGDGGGSVVAQGSPLQISKAEASHTGRFLKPFFKNRVLNEQ
ncbi:MAG: excinuclease ABC subunit UvrA [Deltaproteobacteria bacterium]|nr:excinuclease ABC subunit UvrA [Deltaproteobacteria bacterium]